MSANLELLREELREGGPGGRWLSEVTFVCRGVVSSYAPHAYAGGLSWRDEIEDLVQEVVTERLIAERQALYIVDVALSISDVHRLLARQIRITLAHRRRRTVVDQLLRRARALLAVDPFERLPGSPARWCLSAAEVVDRRPTAQELRDCEASIRSIPVVRGAGVERAPIVYRTEDLQRALVAIAERLSTPVTQQDLDKIFSAVLTSFLPGVLDMAEPAPGSAMTHGAVSAQALEAAARIAQSLSKEQRLIIAAKVSGVADADVAVALGISRPTAAKRRNAAFEVFRRECQVLESDEHSVVLERLAALLAGAWPPGGGDVDTVGE